MLARLTAWVKRAFNRALPPLPPKPAFGRCVIFATDKGFDVYDTRTLKHLGTYPDRPTAVLTATMDGYIVDH